MLAVMPHASLRDAPAERRIRNHSIAHVDASMGYMASNPGAALEAEALTGPQQTAGPPGCRMDEGDVPGLPV